MTRIEETVQGDPLIKGENVPDDGTYDVVAAVTTNQGVISIVFEMNKWKFLKQLVKDGEMSHRSRLGLEDVYEFILCELDDGRQYQTKALMQVATNILASCEMATANDLGGVPARRKKK